jgi:hypothetical protein
MFLNLLLAKGMRECTSAEALMIVPVVAVPWIRPLLTPSEGLKYPAVKTHLPPWKEG